VLAAVSVKGAALHVCAKHVLVVRRTRVAVHRVDAADLAAPSVGSHLPAMRKQRRRKTILLPMMILELAFASWETIGRRGQMMARGKCSPAEYSRMVLEKMAAATRSGSVVSRSKRVPDWTAILDPWHRTAKSNARRLRRK
jgi:hypothetical protein